jgi:hypothetical protein
MEKTKKPALGSFKNKLSAIVGLLELSYIIVLTYVLNVNEGDCSQPIRLWLEVLFYLFAGHFSVFQLTLIISEISKGCRGSVAVVFSLINLLLSVFVPFWVVIGSYWYFTCDSSCSDTFYEGEIATYVILIVYYCFVGAGCCVGCLMWVMMVVGKGITSEVSYY